MKEAIELYNKVAANFKDRDKEQRDKFIYSWSLADPESLEVLNQYDVVLTRSSQGVVLTQEAMRLKQALELAEKMDFIGAYRDDPKRLTQPVTSIIKRMAKCDAMGAPYKNENGKFENFIFSSRGFNKKMIELGMNESSLEEEVEHDASLDNDLSMVEECALRVLEQFAIVEQKDAIFARIHEIGGSGLSTKEILMEAFKICAGNTELLSDAIDEVLESMEVQSVGRGV